MLEQSFTTTNRGRFRQMTVTDLRVFENLPVWNDKTTRLRYNHPILPDAKTSQVLCQGIPTDQLYRLGCFICAKSPQSHIGPFKHAIDYLVLDGTPVFAARDGYVHEIREDSCEWGDDPRFSDHLNFITIEHPGYRYIRRKHFKEFSQYAHLEKGSVSACKLKIGDTVKAGQLIGKVGKSGWTDRDHLHFVVFSEDHLEWQGMFNPFGFKSLKIRFVS